MKFFLCNIRYIHKFIASICICLPVALFAEDMYVFAEQQQQADFIAITKQLRCTVCQNQALYDSMAPLALDLKQEIYNLLLAGKNEQEVTDFLVVRYGDFIKYTPEFRADTWLLWLCPVILLSIGLLLLLSTSKVQKN